MNGPSRDVPPFARRFLDATERVTAIGDGSPGGKARGLLVIRDFLAERFPAGAFPDFRVDVPTLTVIRTDLFDRFMAHNALWPVVQSDANDTRLALAFQAAALPPELVGDLRALIEQVRSPLAIRSSSLLEDALEHPFAGVYATKMIPNDESDADSRFRRLTEAIKLVYASTFFAAARRYRDVAGCGPADEKMAVVIQEIVGRRNGPRFYPDVSGVARSYSFYRSGAARPEDGFVSLALGLGKTIVDGGLAWSYSPAYPHATPPFASPRDLLAQTQHAFWAVSMGGTPRYDPGSDRLHVGLRGSGPRALTFARLLVLEELPLNRLIRELLSVSETALGAPVEIEFALTLADDEEPPGRLGFLQVRPMAVSSRPVIIAPGELDDPRRLVATNAAMGDGVDGTIADVVFVRPDVFEAGRTRAIAVDVADLNQQLLAARRPYLLIGFGRWGSSDPWLGIPVDWSSIAGARAIVETSIAGMTVEPSQGSHFFHNLSSFGVTYFTVRPGIDPPIDWDWLAAQPIAGEMRFARHVRLAAPLLVKVDGRSGRGVILRPAAEGPS